MENKAQFIEGVMTRKAIVKSITLSDPTITIVGNDAIARHTWASDSETDGKRTSTTIGVLQVWQKQGGPLEIAGPPECQAPASASVMTARAGLGDAPQRREAVHGVTGWDRSPLTCLDERHPLVWSCSRRSCADERMYGHV